MSRYDDCCCDNCDNNIENLEISDLLAEIRDKLADDSAGYKPVNVSLIWTDEINKIRRAIKAGDLLEADYLLEKAIFTGKVKDRTGEYRRLMSPPPKVGLWQWL